MNVDKISLTLDVLTLHIIFSLYRAVVVLYPSLEMIDTSYLKLPTASSPWPFVLISLWKPSGTLPRDMSVLYKCVSLILYLCTFFISHYIPPSVLPLLLYGT